MKSMEIPSNYETIFAVLSCAESTQPQLYKQGETHNPAA